MRVVRVKSCDYAVTERRRYLYRSSLMGPLLRCQQRGLGVVQVTCNVQLDPSKQQQNDHNDEDQTQAAAREVTP